MPDKLGSEPKRIAPAKPEKLNFLSAEFAFNRLVKGAPYSATAVTESTQKLSDGNEIIKRMEARIYRDSEGRTRREQTLDSLAKYTLVNDAPMIIFIDDPVAAIQFTLDPRTHTAYRAKGPARPLFQLLDHKRGPFPAQHGVDNPAPPEPKVFAKEKPQKVPTSESGKPDSPTPPDATPQKEAPTLASRDRKMQLKGPAGERPPEMKEPAELQKRATELADDRSKLETQKRTESLGKQMFDGVEAEGTRTTLTIPAGEIGNRLPIEVTDERWYSPEVQILVMSKHSDPRSGETIYRLTNIDRREPDHSLFEMPPDYKWAPSATAPEKLTPRSTPQTRPTPKPARDG